MAWFMAALVTGPCYEASLQALWLFHFFSLSAQLLNLLPSAGNPFQPIFIVLISSYQFHCVQSNFGPVEEGMSCPNSGRHPQLYQSAFPRASCAICRFRRDRAEEMCEIPVDVEAAPWHSGPLTLSCP